MTCDQLPCRDCFGFDFAGLKRGFLSIILALSCFLTPTALGQTQEDSESDQWYAAGIEAFEAEQYERAAGFFSKGILLADGNAGWWINRGNCYSMLEQFDNAERDFSEAIKLAVAVVGEEHPALAGLYYNRGVARKRSGRFRESIADYERVLALDKKYPDVRNNLADLLATAPVEELRDGVRALALAEHALEELEKGTDRYVRGLSTIACVYAELGRFDEARDSIGACLALAEVNEMDVDELVDFREQEALFREGKPYRQESGIEKRGS